MSILGLKDDMVLDSLALGVFDGVHRGHRVLLDYARYGLTFFPHPKNVLTSSNHVGYLTNIEERLFLFPNLLVLSFTKELSLCDPVEFLESVIAPLPLKEIVVGFDFFWGKNKSGDVSLLKSWCDKRGINCHKIPPVSWKGRLVKSGLIRSFMKSGDFESVVDYLSFAYPCFGYVVKGDGRGRTLGFPTANLTVSSEKLLPCSGVYQGYVFYQGKRYDALIYLGNKPSFQSDKEKVVIEVHLLAFSGDLYGEYLKVFIEKKLRDEMKFDTLGSLINQIEEDINKVEK